MSTLIDLHMHSTASDGTKTPRELVTHAYSHKKDNIDSLVIALTDHDTVAGITDFLEEAKKYVSSITAIAGLEISSYRKNSTGKSQEIHILGYGIDPFAPVLLSTLKDYREIRDNRNERIIEKLQEQGFAIHLENICAENPDDTIGRPIIARHLMKMGYVSSIQEAFDRYLAEGRSCYCDRQLPEPEEVISLIHQSGGIAVLAHPVNYKNLSEEELLALIKELKDAGLDGMEVYYSRNSQKATAYYEDLVKSVGLLATGGSDYHAENKADIAMFYGKGNLSVKEEILPAFFQSLSLYR